MRRLWEELGLDTFCKHCLGDQRGEASWGKVVEILAVNHLLDPRSELYVHEKWFEQTAMDVLLDSDPAVAAKDREIVRIHQRIGEIRERFFRWPSSSPIYPV